MKLQNVIEGHDSKYMLSSVIMSRTGHFTVFVRDQYKKEWSYFDSANYDPNAMIHQENTAGDDYPSNIYQTEKRTIMTISAEGEQLEQHSLDHWPVAWIYTRSKIHDYIEDSEACLTSFIDDDIKTDYNTLVSNLNQSKIKALDENKAYLLDLLTEEIVKRYVYREGLFDYLKTHDPEIKKATEIVNSPSAYLEYLR
mgnify:CR=1 FL=1